MTEPAPTPIETLRATVEDERRALNARIDALAAVENSLMRDDPQRYAAERAALESDVQRFCATNDYALQTAFALLLALAPPPGTMNG